MQFIDAGGDFATTYIAETTEGNRYSVECVASTDEGEYVSLMLDPAMARALAADLIAFADSAEKEEET